MSLLLEQETYRASADLNLWFKVQSGETLRMSDVPRLIPLRWTFFRDNWDYFKNTLDGAVENYPEKDLLLEQMRDFSDYVATQRTVSPKVNPFSDQSIFYRYYSVFDIIEITAIPMTNKENAIVQEEVKRVSAFTKNDFLKIRSLLIKSRDEMADLVDGTDSTYNTTYRRSPIAPQTKIKTLDITKMLQYQEAIKSVDFILANIFFTDTASVDPFALAKENANNPEFDINTYSSGTLVKLNYGESLESLASRTLGDPDKWIDIAIANGLKPPYIDEVGQELPLLSNGSGNKINIAGTDASGNPNIDKMYINQRVIISSNTQLFPDQRIITNLTQVPVSGEIIMELSGEDNMDMYTILDEAYIRIYKPNTANSSQFVLIPSTDPIDDQSVSDIPWFLATKGDDEKRAKVDLFINEDGDLNFNTTSDLQLSYGIENDMQAIRLKMGIEQNSLPRHLGFGLPPVQGQTNRDIGALKQSLIDSITKQIEADSRFDRVERLDVQYLPDQGSAATGFFITLVVKLAGSNAKLPITFSINIR